MVEIHTLAYGTAIDLDTFKVLFLHVAAAFWTFHPVFQPPLFAFSLFMIHAIGFKPLLMFLVSLLQQETFVFKKPLVLLVFSSF